MAARDKRSYRRRAARLRRTSVICWLCGEAIDTDLPPHHARSWTADHVDPLANGGDVDGLIRPAHRDCNASKGNGAPRRQPSPSSGAW